MKTNKKLLFLAVSLGITSLISGGLSLGFSAFFSIPFWGSFWFFFCAQILGSLAWDRYMETNKIVSEVKAYNMKPYKKYFIPLNCAHCGHKNEIEIDLTDTEFRCSNCLKYNGIHVNFMTAAITEPVSQVES
jgi:DNA-directed RNA polymerase subunit RPC12/RpoP